MKNKIFLKQENGTFRIYNQTSKNNRANRFLEALEIRGLSVQTIRSYGFDLIYFLRWLHIVKINFKNFSQKDLLRFISYQRLNQAKPKSINRRLTTCELFYKFCFNLSIKEAKGVNKPSPFYKGRGLDKHLGIFNMGKPDGMKLRVKVPSQIIEILTPKDIALFLKDIQKYRDLSIIYLMLLCGVRFSEVLDIKILNIDWAGLIIKVTGKGHKERIIPIPQSLKELLKKYISLERPSNSHKENLFVILQGQKKGFPMTKAGLRSLFRYRRKYSGILNANPHKFRHTFGSRMAAENVNLPILQKLMGHSDISTTLRYIHLSTHDVVKEFQKAITEMEKDYGQ